MRLRRDPRPPCRPLPRRPARRGRSDRPPLPAGHDDPRDDVGHADRLAARARRARARPLAPRRGALAPLRPLPARPRGRPRAAAHDALPQRLRRRRDGLRAGVRLRAQTRDWHYEGEGYGDGVCTVEGQAMRLRLRSDMRLGFEGPRARAETRLRAGETRFCALGWSEHLPPATYEEASAQLPTPATSGTSGSAAGASPTTPGACTCSAPRSR